MKIFSIYSILACLCLAGCNDVKLNLSEKQISLSKQEAAEILEQCQIAESGIRFTWKLADLESEGFGLHREIKPDPERYPLVVTRTDGEIMCVRKIVDRDKRLANFAIPLSGLMPDAETE